MTEFALIMALWLGLGSIFSMVFHRWVEPFKGEAYAASSHAVFIIIWWIIIPVCGAVFVIWLFGKGYMAMFEWFKDHPKHRETREELLERSEREYDEAVRSNDDGLAR